MTALTNAQIAVLRAAQIGMADDSNGDPRRGDRHRYQGVDGRIARGLCLRGLLAYEPVDPANRNAGRLLKLTDKGRAALAATTTAAPAAVEPMPSAALTEQPRPRRER